MNLRASRSTQPNESKVSQAPPQSAPSAEKGAVRPPAAASAAINRPEAAIPPSLEALAAFTPKPEKGTLWWNADSKEEAEQWKAELLAKGAESVEMKPDVDSERVRVFITLDRLRANEILGYPVEDEEWLIPEDPPLGSAIPSLNAKRQQFVDLIARMTTDSEMEDGMSGDDAVMTLGEIIATARQLAEGSPATAISDSGQGIGTETPIPWLEGSPTIGKLLDDYRMECLKSAKMLTALRWIAHTAGSAYHSDGGEVVAGEMERRARTTVTMVEALEGPPLVEGSSRSLEQTLHEALVEQQAEKIAKWCRLGWGFREAVEHFAPVALGRDIPGAVKSRAKELLNEPGGKAILP